MKKENFIIQNIVVEEIKGNKLASIYLNFKETSMPVVGIISDISPMHICYDSKRPKELNSANEIFQCYANINEFFGDLTGIIYFLNNEQVLNDSSILKVVEYTCGEHIKRSGRLIDSDLFSYVDLTIIAKNTIWSTIKLQPINQDEAEDLWIELRNHVLKIFKNYIYITKYDMSNPMEPKPYLVQMK